MGRRTTLKGQFEEGWSEWVGTLGFGGLVIKN